MSIKTLDSALDFLPGDSKGNHRPNKLRQVLAFFGAIADGLTALHAYKRLTARGVTTQEAAKLALDGIKAGR
jgi:hypothetical protein